MGIHSHGPEPLYSPHSLSRRVPSLSPRPLAASTCVCHHLSPPLPSSLPPSPPRRRLLDAPARITPPTLCSNRLKFSYRHVYRPSLCLEQVKCTATVVAPGSTMLFSTFRRHCCAGREWQGDLDVRFSSFALWNIPVFLRLNGREAANYDPFAWKITDKIERMSISTKTLSAFLHVRWISQTFVRYDEESRLFCERTAINSTTSFFFRDTGRKRRPLYVCLTRTRRMNNRIVKYFSVTPYDSGWEPSPLIVKVDWNFYVSLSAAWVKRSKIVSLFEFYPSFFIHLPFLRWVEFLNFCFLFV